MRGQERPTRRPLDVTGLYPLTALLILHLLPASLASQGSLASRPSPPPPPAPPPLPPTFDTGNGLYCFKGTVRQVSPPGSSGALLYYLVTSTPTGQLGSCVDPPPQPPAPPPSPPPPAPYIGLASGGGREGGGTGSQDSASNATGAQPQQQLKPTYAVLLNLRNLTADPAALAQVQQGAPLFVTGYPQSSRNSDNGVRQTTVLLVVKLRRDDSVQFSGGPAEVLRPLWTSDRLDAPALEIKVGVVAVTVPALEWTDDDNDGVMDGAAAFQAGAVVSNWLDEATNLRNFVDVCSWGKAQLSPNNADDIYNFGAGYTEVALTGIDLGALGDEAAAQAQDAAVAGAATTPLQGWAVCVGYLLGRMRSTAEAQLRGEGSTFGTDWDYVLFALPEGVKALAARSCATAAVAGGGGGGGGGGVAGDGGTQVDWLVSQVSSVLLIASQLNCRRTGQGDAADVCGSSFAGVGGDTTLVNAAVRGLGGNFGLRQALVPSALAELATQDPSSGLSGADVQCFNGPQSWLLGWAEIATGQDLVWNLDNPAAFASQWFTLQAYGSVRGTLLRLRVLHGAGAARSSVFWVVFRAAASSTANRKVPIKQLFLTGTVRDAVHVYEMSSGRNERIASSPDPIWWGYAPSPLNPYVAAPVREAAMAGPGAGATSDVGTEPPLAWLKVWPEQRMQANRLALTAPVRMCLVWSPDAECGDPAPPPPAAATTGGGGVSARTMPLLPPPPEAPSQPPPGWPLQPPPPDAPVPPPVAPPAPPSPAPPAVVPLPLPASLVPQQPNQASAGSAASPQPAAQPPSDSPSPLPRPPLVPLPFRPATDSQPLSPAPSTPSVHPPASQQQTPSQSPQSPTTGAEPPQQQAITAPAPLPPARLRPPPSAGKLPAAAVAKQATAAPPILAPAAVPQPWAPVAGEPLGAAAAQQHQHQRPPPYAPPAVQRHPAVVYGGGRDGVFYGRTPQPAPAVAAHPAAVHGGIGYGGYGGGYGNYGGRYSGGAAAYGYGGRGHHGYYSLGGYRARPGYGNGGYGYAGYGGAAFISREDFA